jgi:hypothetical protein
MTAKKFVPRPDHVFIGHLTVGIEWLSEDEWEIRRLGDDLRGISDHMKSFIGMRLMPATPEAMFQETLVHEILHLVWATMGLNHTHLHFPADEREEAIITTQSAGLMFVIQNNPEVMAYLTSDGTEVRR